MNDDRPERKSEERRFVARAASAEYELVRSSFDRFLVVPGHEIEIVEDVVERQDGYFVVAKRDGQAVAMAAVTDDRDGG